MPDTSRKTKSFFHVCAQARDEGGTAKGRKVNKGHKANHTKKKTKKKKEGAPTSKLFDTKDMPSRKASKLFLLNATYDSAKINSDYVALNLSYVLGFNKKDAMTFAQKAHEYGAVCLAEGSTEECQEVMAKLKIRDMVCAVEIGADNTILTSDPSIGEEQVTVKRIEKKVDDWDNIAANWVPSDKCNELANVKATSSAKSPESPISPRSIDSQNTYSTEDSSLNSCEVDSPFLVSVHSPASSLSWTPKTPTDEDRLQGDAKKETKNMVSVPDEAESSIFFPQFGKTEHQDEEAEKTSTKSGNDKEVKILNEASEQNNNNAWHQISYRKSEHSCPTGAKSEISKDDYKEVKEATVNEGESQASASSVLNAGAEIEAESATPTPSSTKDSHTTKQTGRFGTLFSFGRGGKKAALQAVEEEAPGGLEPLFLGKYGDERYLKTLETINSEEIKEAVQNYIGSKPVQAVFVYPNGVGTYNGEWAGGIPHGVGTFFWTDGAEYAGEWIEGSPEGDGKFLYPNKAMCVRSSHTADIIRCAPPVNVKDQSAVVLQTTWRSVSTRRSYERLLSAVVVVQILTRGRIERSRYLTMIHACSVCQAAIRGMQTRVALKEAEEKERAQYILRAQSAVVLQSTWRSVTSRESHKKLRSSAVVVQALARSQTERLRYLTLLRACIVCQATVRGMQTRAALREAEEMKEQDAIKETERLRYLTLLRACIVCQAAVRGMQTRAALREATKMKEQANIKETKERAAISIQKAWSQNRSNVTALREASASTLQSTWRSASLRRNHERLRSSTIVVQALARGQTERIKYLTLLRACIVCQAAVRGTQTRAALKEVEVNEQAVVKETEESATSSIQETEIQNASRMEAVTLLQSSWRTISSRRGYERLRSSVIVVQTLARGRRERMRYLAIRRACMVCQAFLRRKQTRGALIIDVSSNNDDEVSTLPGWDYWDDQDTVFSSSFCKDDEASRSVRFNVPESDDEEGPSVAEKTLDDDASRSIRSNVPEESDDEKDRAVAEKILDDDESRSILHNAPEETDDKKGQEVATKTLSHYKGDMVNGLPNGKGRMYLPDGSRYSGQWKDGKPSGKGKMYFKNGEVHIGRWCGTTFVPLKVVHMSTATLKPAGNVSAVEGKTKQEAAKKAQGIKKTASSRKREKRISTMAEF